MNYATIVDKFKTIILDHKIIHDFGYGELSDIKVLAEDAEGVNDADYPYAFLNPAGVAQNNAARTYSFNLILMEMVINPLETVNIQSRCIQYIDDIVSKFNAGTVQDITLQYTTQVFKERFQDEVAGATASITVRDLNPLNDCIAPFVPIVPPPPSGGLVLEVTSNVAQTFPVDIAQSPWKAQIITLDTQNGWRQPTGFNFFTAAIDGTWNFVLEGVGRVASDNGDWPGSPVTLSESAAIEIPATTSNWPTTQPPIQTPFNFRVEWNGIFKFANGKYMAWNWIDIPGTAEDTFIIEAGTTLKGYFTPA